MTERKCLECGTKLLGRIDQKYCSDHCRNAYNNRLNRDSRNLLRNINNKLRKNYRLKRDSRNRLRNINNTLRKNYSILGSFALTDGKTKTTKMRLLDNAFDFEYITNLYTPKKGSTYFFVYDLGYLPLDNDYYMIVKRE